MSTIGLFETEVLVTRPDVDLIARCKVYKVSRTDTTCRLSIQEVRPEDGSDDPAQLTDEEEELVRFEAWQDWGDHLEAAREAAEAQRYDQHRAWLRGER